MRLHVTIPHALLHLLPANPAETPSFVLRVLVLTLVRLVLSIVVESRGTEAAIPHIVSTQVVSFRSPPLFITRMSLQTSRRVELFTAVLADEAGGAHVDRHVELHGSSGEEIFAAEV
jgi:hypothetical protein